MPSTPDQKPTLDYATPTKGSAKYLIEDIFRAGIIGTSAGAVVGLFGADVLNRLQILQRAYYDTRLMIAVVSGAGAGFLLGVAFGIILRLWWRRP